MDKNKYTLVPGMGNNLSSNKLWIADDHLLLQKQVADREEYTRFYFRDIQGLIVSKDSSSLVSLIVLLIGGGIFALALFYLNYTAAICIIACMVFAIIRMILGWRNCQTFLQTSVTLQKLSSFSERKQIAELEKIIAEKISEYQAKQKEVLLSGKPGVVEADGEYFEIAFEKQNQAATQAVNGQYGDTFYAPAPSNTPINFQ